MSYCPGQILVCAYTIWLSFSFLHIALWITFPKQLFLVIFCVSLLHSLIIIIPLEFFTPVLADGLSVESE